MMSKQSELIFFVNGKRVVESQPDPEWTLSYYLRVKLRLCGTKEGCGEGGCGVCTVLISHFDATTGKIINNAINACLTPICSVHGTAIITVEGIGSVRRGLHPVQERIAKSHGTQCGFCTPGFVMSMYALLRNNPNPTEQEMEDAFQGNLCRCTGYRPILAGYKTLCKKNGINGSGCCGRKVGPGGKCCMESGEGMRREVAETLIDESEFKNYDPEEDIIFPPELQLNKTIQLEEVAFTKGNVTWYKPNSLEKLLQLRDAYPGSKLIGGNTEIGIEARFKRQHYPVLIQVSQLTPLTKLKIEDNTFKIGSVVTLSQLKQFCAAQHPIRGTVFYVIEEMLHYFAGQQIRNVATIAGNIVTASPISDLNPILMTCGAKLNLISLKGGKRTVLMDEQFFPKYRTTILRETEILESIEIPLTQNDEFIWAAKQARRREDDIAIVNACMKVQLDLETKKIKDAIFVFGGMAATPKIARKTSDFFISKYWSEETIDSGANELLQELLLPYDAPGGMVAYRQILAQSFFQKFSLAVSSWEAKASSDMTFASSVDNSALEPLSRGSTSDTQLYQIVPESQNVQDLIGRPVVHLGGLKHATGEAVYTDDELPIHGQLHGYLVGSPVAHGKIIKVDPTPALKVEGVVAFFSAKDVTPEQNKFGWGVKDEELFASELVQAEGQTIGIIIADDPFIAEKASKMVHIEIEELSPILTMEQAIEKGSYNGKRELKCGDVSKVFASNVDILEGEFRFGGQEHFYMETNCCIATPKEDEEMDVLVSVQGPDKVQRHVAETLEIPASKVKVRCRRMGGSFGGKASRPILVAVPTAVAAMRLSKSVRTVMNRWDDMVLTGGRHPYLYRYKVAYTKEGQVLAIQATVYANGGWSQDHSTAVLQKMLWGIDGAHIVPNWDVTGLVCKTNLASNTAYRGYGAPQGTMFIENILDLVAEKVGRSPVDIRKMHLKPPSGAKGPYGTEIKDCTVGRCWEECLINSKYEERLEEVNAFNAQSRFKKRGITVLPMKHGVGFLKNVMNQGSAMVMAYTDGSVGLHHGGIEMGQGLITKMVQVATRALGGHVPFDKIHFSETSTSHIPNASTTCGSFSADLLGHAVIKACEKLMKRLEPFRKANPNGTWRDWVLTANSNRVNLAAIGFFETDINFDFTNPTDLSKPTNMYTVYGAACSEVEVDVMTGDHSVLRTDIVIDCGESMNPAVDIGQIEGAFVQGYGLFTMEELLYSPKGHMLTKGPGMYKIPGMGDIPRQFHVSFLRGAACPKAVYSSKGVGEPPLCLAASIYFAIKEAVKEVRREGGHSTSFRFDCPATAERIRLACEDNKVAKVKKEMMESGSKSNSVGWAVTV